MQELLAWANLQKLYVYIIKYLKEGYKFLSGQIYGFLLLRINAY